VRQFAESSRERFLQPDEVSRFFKALVDEPNETIRDYLMMSLLTGARRADVLSMRWDQVNFERAEWRIPTTKSGKPHTIPLLGEAVSILKRRHPNGHCDEKPYVFGGPGVRGHLVEPKKGWRRVLDRAELYQLTEWIGEEKGWTQTQIAEARTGSHFRKPLKEARAAIKALGRDPRAARIVDLRIHDLRRTLGSWQAATGASLPTPRARCSSGSRRRRRSTS